MENVRKGKGDEPTRDSDGLRTYDHVILYLCLAAWVLLFVIGTLVDSQPYRDAVARLGGQPLATLLGNFGIVIVTYTLTNIGLMCLFAGVLGTLGRRSQLGPDSGAPAPRDSLNPRNSAVLRGFLVYLAIISGVVILGDDPASPTQRQYVRLAGFASLFSFIVNVNPALFSGVLRKMGDVVEGKIGESEKAATEGAENERSGD